MATTPAEGAGVSEQAIGRGNRPMTEVLADVLAQEVFIRSQGWSEWPTLDEIKEDAPSIVQAMGEATGWGGFDAWDEGTKRVSVAFLDALEEGGLI